MKYESSGCSQLEVTRGETLCVVVSNDAARVEPALARVLVVKVPAALQCHQRVPSLRCGAQLPPLTLALPRRSADSTATVTGRRGSPLHVGVRGSVRGCGGGGGRGHRRSIASAAQWPHLFPSVLPCEAAGRITSEAKAAKNGRIHQHVLRLGAVWGLADSALRRAHYRSGELGNASMSCNGFRAVLRGG